MYNDRGHPFAHLLTQFGMRYITETTQIQHIKPTLRKSAHNLIHPMEGTHKILSFTLILHTQGKEKWIKTYHLLKLHLKGENSKLSDNREGIACEFTHHVHHRQN